MSADALPGHIHPVKLSDKGAALEGELPLAPMLRLADTTRAVRPNAHVRLQFGKDDEGHRVIRGEAAACLQMTCQRCLQSVDYELQASLALGLVFSEAMAKQLPAAYDPLILDEEAVSLSAMIEDELILSLPIVARHDDCAPDSDRGAVVAPEPADSEATAEEEEKANPFDVLAQLKSDSESEH